MEFMSHPTTNRMICYDCGKPPLPNQKLLKCRNCHWAMYHDAICQRRDWKQHKRICSSIGAIAWPLHHEIETGGDAWWKKITFSDRKQHDHLWNKGYRLWCLNQDYLLAVELFQQSLEGCQKVWQQYLHDKKGIQNEKREIQQTISKNIPGDRFAFTLAQRLLFCAYCELDGQAIDSGRQRLLQCISILFQTKSGWSNQQLHNWDDVWMELMLSMEEVADQRQYAKNVAAIALSSISNTDSAGPCRWIDVWQRPGYMAPPLQGTSLPFIHRHQHPSWCRQLEQHFPQILEEYQTLRRSQHGWSQVGCGDRGSGHEDHRVVVGQDWSEYVLFGTGESSCTGASRTRSLIREILPDAVSLAQQGGGEVIFSRLAPHTHIQAHCGPTNLRWTAHLGLVIPTTSDRERFCKIRVGTEWHDWKLGEVLLFDDSFEHEVRNDTNEERVVLLLRLWHPDLPHQLRGKCLMEARENKDAAVKKRYDPPQ